MASLSAPGLSAPSLPLAQIGQSFPNKTVAASSTPDTIRKVAEEYEGIFIAQLMQTMFSGLETDGMFSGGHSEGVYRDLMVDDYGKSIAKSGGIGVADNIAQQLLSMQEV